MVNKVRENAATWSSSSVSSAGVSCSITPWATIQLNPALLPPCLSSSLVPLPRGEQCFSILSALSATYSILYTLSYSIYPCARVSARYSQPRSFPGFFPFNFLVFLPLRLHQRYQSLYLYLRPFPPLPRILTSDCNFGSFVSSSLGNLLFLPVLYLIFSFNHELSIDPSFIVQLASSVLNFPVPHPPDVLRILISSHFSYLAFFFRLGELKTA